MQAVAVEVQGRIITALTRRNGPHIGIEEWRNPSYG
jgi:hypothetical protein